MMDDYIANERNICLIVDDRASGKNWWYWINKWFGIHTSIAKQYTIKRAEGKEEKSYDIFAFDLDTQETILLAEMKQDDLLLDMNQLEHELVNVYTPLLAKLSNPRMHLICAPSPDKKTKADRSYDYPVVKRLIGFMNDYPWVRYHIHLNPLKAVQKLDRLIRYPPAKIESTIPIYAPKARKSFGHSICNLMPGISIGMGDWLGDHMNPDITEHELVLLMKAYDNKTHDELAFKLYMKLQETWYR